MSLGPKLRPPERVWVKICGITSPVDAEAAMEAGADALGFNLYPKSKRHVRLEDIRPWVLALAATVRRVAVMVNPSLPEARRAQELFDVVQLHGNETPEFCSELAAYGPVWKALPLLAGLDAAVAAHFETEALLVDAFVPGAFGGTGQLIDLSGAADFVAGCKGRPVWISGGLTPENVREAVRIVSPFGVDVASGVECSGDARRKDRTRMQAFIQAAREG